MVLPRNQKLLAECNYKFEHIPVSVNDFEFWRKVRSETTLKLCRMLLRECHFYQELQKRRTQFCQVFYGDVYSMANIFGHRNAISYDNLYNWLKDLNILFNTDEFEALLRRAKHR